MTSSCWHDYQFTKVNWIDFTFIDLTFERDRMVNTAEVHVALLGFHWRVVWHGELFNSTEKQALQDILDETPRWRS
jgi:hypothetical protein